MSSRANTWYLLVFFIGLGFVVFAAGRCAVRPAEGLLPAIMPVQRGLTQSGDSVRSFIAGLTRGWRLEEENRALRDELQRITGEIARLRQAEIDNEDLRTLLQFQRANSQWDYIGASVVSFDGHRLAQTVVIDRGADQGVEAGLIVVVAGGLVGRVTEVGPKAAQVLLLTDPRSAVNAEVQGSDASGIVRAVAGGELVLDFVDRNAAVKEGDLVVTSGLGGAYPPGLLVGQVTDVAQDRDSHIFLQVRLRQAVAFERLRHVLVVRDFTPLAFP